MTEITFSNNEEWLEKRAKYITASDVAALVQYYHQDMLDKSDIYLHSYSSAFEIYHRLKGNYEQPKPDIQMQYLFDKGHACEKPMAMYFMRKYEIPVRNKEGISMFVSDELDFFSCTPDFIIEPTHANITISNDKIITPKDGIGILETKTIRYDQYCNKYFDGEPPFQFLLQLQTQLMCTGAKWGLILTDNGYGIEEFFYMHDENIANLIIDSVKKFKHDLDNNIEPDPTERKNDSDIVKNMFELTDDYKDATSDQELNKLCEERIIFKEAEKENKKKSDKLANQIRIKAEGYKLTETEEYRISLSKNNRLTIKKR